VEEFLLDSGDALEMVTPSLQAKLGLMAPKASGGIMRLLLVAKSW
jgi:hypothetical protein